MNTDAHWMKEALALAAQAGTICEVPVGAVVVREDQIVGRGFNRREVDRDPLAHAELLAIREAAHTLDRWRLTGCTLYVTLEPCPMCLGAMVNARVDRLVFGAKETKARPNHFVQIDSGVLAQEASNLLSDFFKRLRF